MAFQIVWSKRAVEKFDGIIDYLSKEWGEKVTSSFVRKVYDFIDLLAEYPEIGSLENTKKYIRGFILIKQICVFYKIKRDAIIILSFFDTRQNPKRKRF
jgi:plasmid stabilization system protein ParE